MTDFLSWMLEASAALAKHDIDPRAIRHRKWRNLFIAGCLPADAAFELKSDYVNNLPVKKPEETARCWM